MMTQPEEPAGEPSDEQPGGQEMLERLRERGLISEEEFAERTGQAPQAGPPPTAAASPGALDAGQMERLERLASLRDRGVLSEAEFAEQRDRVYASPTPPAAPPVAVYGAYLGGVAYGETARDELRRQGLVFRKFPTWLAVVLDVITLSVFGYIWINHWHGLMPKRRPDDPSTARAIGFLFIPLFNIYWVFESHLRLVTRLDEEFGAAGLPDRIPRELVRWTIILYLIPYAGFITFVLAPVRTGMMQSRVNQLADVDTAWRESQRQ